MEVTIQTDDFISGVAEYGRQDGADVPPMAGNQNTHLGRPFTFTPWMTLGGSVSIVPIGGRRSDA
jgi:hypothetical protein